MSQLIESNGASQVPTYYDYLKPSLKRAYSLLDPSTDNPDDFYVVDLMGMRDFMNNTECMDRAITTHGITQEIPPIRCYRLHDNVRNPVFGITLYETRNKISANNESIRYVSITTCTPSDSLFSGLVCKKGDLFRLKRYFNRQNKNGLIKYPPILKDGLLESIISNSIDFLSRRKQFEHYNVKLSRGLVLQGKPGNGKTMACKWLRALCGKGSYSTTSIAPASIEKSYRENTLNSLVNSADIVFFDDIDVSFFSRSNKNGAFGDAKVACALLAALDGVEGRSGTVRIFTTNERLMDIDPAFLRPGRIDKIYTFENPTPALREKLIKETWHEEIQQAFDISTLVDATEGLSFAEVEEIKTLIVHHKIKHDNWDLNEALDEFTGRIEKIGQKKSFGFAQED